MKAIVTFAAAVLLCLSASAQTQQGFVKTKGRMVNGKLVPGQGLKDATVSIKGRTTVLVKGDDGAFSFPTPEAQFRMDSVKKKGYQLVDLEACPRSYKYSSNPLYIIMETPEQQLQDKLTAERKIRRNLQKQLQEREDEIEDLKAQQQISDEEYRQALQKLYQDQESNEQLISDMAKRYSELDYDQLDEFYQQVSYCIENGDLVKADSLLKTRGDITEQVGDLLQRGQALQEEKEQLQKAEAVQQTDIEEAARRCYSYYETLKAQHLNDTAAYFLELRAKLDTTNVEWQFEAGDFIQDYIADYDKAMTYRQRSLRLALAQPTEDPRTVIVSYTNLGAIYASQDNYPKALEYYNEAYKLASASKDYLEELATCYNDMGLVYEKQGDYSKAMENYEKSLKAEKSLPVENHIHIASTYNNLGMINYLLGDNDKALDYLLQSLSLKEAELDESSMDLSITYNNLGVVTEEMGDYESAMSYYTKAMGILESAVGKSHPFKAISLSNIGNVYAFQRDYEKALEYHLAALSIRKAVFGENHTEVAYSYHLLGRLYCNLGDYAKALDYDSQALKIRKSLFGENHIDVATSYNELGIIYANLGDYPKALEYIQHALESYLLVFGENHPYVAVSYNNLGLVYYKMDNYDKSLEYYQKSLALYESLYREDYSECDKIKERIETVKEKAKEKDGNE